MWEAFVDFIWNDPYIKGKGEIAGIHCKIPMCFKMLTVAFVLNHALIDITMQY